MSVQSIPLVQDPTAVVGHVASLGAIFMAFSGVMPAIVATLASLAAFVWYALQAYVLARKIWNHHLREKQGLTVHVTEHFRHPPDDA